VVGQTLGFMGAEVYKIESRARIDLTRMLPPFGEGVRDPDRSLSNHACWAGNGSVSLNLKHPRPRARARPDREVRRRDRELRARRHGGTRARMGRSPRVKPDLVMFSMPAAGLTVR
jgi:benzylsuccinate CoA-transferase BbsF subunit